MALTPKQEKYCLKYVECSNKTEAYRHAYDCSNMLDESVNNMAYKLSNNLDITSRIEELQNKLEKKALYSIEESQKNDLQLIKNYNDAIVVLQDKSAKDKDIEVAQRTIKYIGSTGYSQAQDRISKQSGYFEKDNKQKTVTGSKINLNINGNDIKLK